MKGRTLIAGEDEEGEAGRNEIRENRSKERLEANPNDIVDDLLVAWGASSKGMDSSALCSELTLGDALFLIMGHDPTREDAREAAKRGRLRAVELNPAQRVECIEGPMSCSRCGIDLSRYDRWQDGDRNKLCGQHFREAYPERFPGWQAPPKVSN